MLPENEVALGNGTETDIGKVKRVTTVTVTEIEIGIEGIGDEAQVGTAIALDEVYFYDLTWFVCRSSRPLTFSL